MAIITLPFPRVTSSKDKRNAGDGQKVISIEDRLGVVFLPARHGSRPNPHPSPAPDDGDAA